MRDSDTINEAVDLLECAGWKGYAQAVREQAAELAAYRARDESDGEALRILAGYAATSTGSPRDTERWIEWARDEAARRQLEFVYTQPMQTNPAPRATLTTCWETFGHADGRVTVEKLWYLIPEDTSQRRFLGLLDRTTEADAVALAERVVGGPVRRMR